MQISLVHQEVQYMPPMESFNGGAQATSSSAVPSMSLQGLADPSSGQMDYLLRSLGGSSYSRGPSSSGQSRSSSVSHVASQVKELFSLWAAQAASFSASLDGAFWQGLCEVLRRLPDALVRELVLAESDFLLLLLNQLGSDRGASATNIWTLCCRIFTRCFEVCGNLIWNLVDWTVADCLRDLLDVLAILPWYMDPASAVETAEAPLVLLARLMMLSYAKWPEAATRDFCEHLERHVAICSEAGVWSAALKQCIEALSLRAVSHLRQRLFEASNVSDSFAAGVNIINKDMFAARDALETVDVTLIKILCVKCDCVVLASNGLLGLIASCHAAVCTCPDPALSSAGSRAPQLVELITNRHSAVANFLLHVVQLPSFSEHSTVFAMCTPALLASANDVIKSSATVLLHRLASLNNHSNEPIFPYPKILNKCFIVESNVIIGVLSDGFKQLSALGFSVGDLIADLVPKTTSNESQLLSSFLVGIEKVFVDICSPSALKAFARCSGSESCVSCREGLLKFMKTLNLLDMVVMGMSKRKIFIENEIRFVNDICETLQKSLKCTIGVGTGLCKCTQKILVRAQSVLVESHRALSNVMVNSHSVAHSANTHDSTAIRLSSLSQRKTIDLISESNENRAIAAAEETTRKNPTESWFSRLAQTKKEDMDASKLQNSRKRRLYDDKNSFQFQDLRTSKPAPVPPPISSRQRETASSKVYGAGAQSRGLDIRQYWGHRPEGEDDEGFRSTSRPRLGHDRDDASGSYSIDSERARTFMRATGDDSLDIYQEGPRDVASLDDGYEDYEKIAEEKRKAAMKTSSSMAVDMDQLLGNFLGPAPSIRSNTTAGNKRITALSSDVIRADQNASSTEHQSSTLSDFLKKVAIDIFYKHVLSIKLRSSDQSTKKVLESVPNRFIHDDQYIEIFLPLLLAEVESSLRASVDRIITEDAIRTRGYARSKPPSGGSRNANKSECHVIGARCVLVHTWMPPSSKDRKSSPDGVVIDPDDPVAPAARLDEVHIVAEKGPSVNRDDIVIIIDITDTEGQRPSSLTKALEVPHSVAIAISNAESKTVMRASHVSSNYQPQQSLLMLQGTSPTEDRELVLFTLGSITTHLREWAALSSVRQQELMPLTPYILRASPVTSSQTLVAKRDAILKLSSRLNRATDSDSIAEISGLLRQTIFELILHRVDVSVLQLSGILDVLKSLKGVANITSEIMDLAAEVRKTWKNQIKTDHRISTLRGMKGGRVAEIPEDVSAILKPESVPDFLWSQLVDQYNRSQLFAIRYVVELQREDMRQDTQISLIQGPPGTGKTKTILGLVAVLLQRQRNSSKSGPESQVSVWSPDFSTGAGSRKQRILICAPSNAAIDELLSRLAKGVLNSRAGEGPRYFNLVRLGSVSEASSTELAEYTLDSKTTMVVEKSQLYQDFIALEEEISGLVQAINASEYQSPASSTKSSDRWPSRHELKVKLRKNIQDKMRMKAALDRMVVNVRNSILDAADVVMGTLSAAGSRQLMDYIESTHFETEKSREEISMASGNIAQTFDQSLVANRHARRFDTVIVDESAQATEPSTLIPLRFGCRKLVLVGDPRQLPATVLDKRAAAAGLGVSLFERLERSDHEVVMLQIQYRMHPEICAFPSNFFYNGKLVDSDTVLSYVPVYDTDFSLVAPDPSAARAASQLLSQLTPPGFLLRMKPKTPAEPSFASFSTVDGTSRGKHTSLTSGDSSFSVSYYLERNSSIFLRSIEFINVTTSVEENDSHNRKTLINRQEAVVVIALLQFLTRHFRGISIGIITPYEGQKRFIRNLIMDLPSAARECIEINTVDGFQGREKDVVIISCVRTSRSNIGFLSDERRMNVAITRARRSLIILGSTEALATNDASWAAFIDHVKRKNGLSSVSLTPLS